MSYKETSRFKLVPEVPHALVTSQGDIFCRQILVATEVKRNGWRTKVQLNIFGEKDNIFCRSPQASPVSHSVLVEAKLHIVDRRATLDGRHLFVMTLAPRTRHYPTACPAEQLPFVLYIHNWTFPRLQIRPSGNRSIQTSSSITAGRRLGEGIAPVSCVSISCRIQWRRVDVMGDFRPCGQL